MPSTHTKRYENWTDEQKSRALAIRAMGETRVGASRVTGIPYSTIQHWENGTGAPPPEMVELAKLDLPGMFERVSRDAIEDLSKDELKSLDPDVRVRVAATAAKAAIDLRQEGQPSKHISMHASAQDARDALKALLAERMGLNAPDTTDLQELPPADVQGGTGREYEAGAGGAGTEAQTLFSSESK